MHKALVLGGGGVTGIAWEIGLLAGLRGAGIDLRATTDLIVGTSAGSVVGAMLASGVDLDAAVAEQRVPDPNETPIHADMNRVMQAFALLFDASIDPREARAQVGALALGAPVGDEATYLARFAARVPETAAWPARPRLLITGVDAQSGEPIAWDAAAGAPLLRAVAASCAVPCVFPPVTIAGRRYMDGGVRSHANMDLAAGATHVVVIAPMAAMAPHSHAEREALGAAEVLLIGPDESALAAIGPNVMDVHRRADALAAGLAQGAALRDEVKRVWG